MKRGARQEQSPEPGQQHADIEALVRRAVQGLRYGSVEITVHNAQVVQIERRERFRPEDAPREGERPD